MKCYGTWTRTEQFLCDECDLDEEECREFSMSCLDGVKLRDLKDVVIVRCGRTPAEEAPYVMDRINTIGELL